MKKLLAAKVTGTQYIKIPNGWKLGDICVSGTSSGAGSIIVYDGEATTDDIIAVCRSYVNDGNIMQGPFAHTATTLTAVVAGTGAFGDVYAWCP